MSSASADVKIEIFPKIASYPCQNMFGNVSTNKYNKDYCEGVISGINIFSIRTLKFVITIITFF